MEINNEHRPSPFAVAGLIAVLTAISAVIALMCAWAVVFLVFRDTRGDGLAVLEISFLSVGLFVTIIVNTYMLREKRLAAIPAAFWIALALACTYSVCRDSFITWQNWRWILQSGDPRSYQLGWIIRGWIDIIIAGGCGLVAAIAIARRGERRDSQLAEAGASEGS